MYITCPCYYSCICSRKTMYSLSEYVNGSVFYSRGFIFIEIPSMCIYFSHNGVSHYAFCLSAFPFINSSFLIPPSRLPFHHSQFSHFLPFDVFPLTSLTFSRLTSLVSLLSLLLLFSLSLISLLSLLSLFSLSLISPFPHFPDTPNIPHHFIGLRRSLHLKRAFTELVKKCLITPSLGAAQSNTWILQGRCINQSNNLSLSS